MARVEEYGFKGSIESGDSFQCVDANGSVIRVAKDTVVNDIIASIPTTSTDLDSGAYQGIVTPSSDPSDAGLDIELKGNWVMTNTAGTYTYFLDYFGNQIVISDDRTYIFTYKKEGTTEYWQSEPVLSAASDPSLFIGIIRPSDTAPVAPTDQTWGIAQTTGEYTDFDGITVTYYGQAVYFIYDSETSSWLKDEKGATTPENLGTALTTTTPKGEPNYQDYYTIGEDGDYINFFGFSRTLYNTNNLDKLVWSGGKWNLVRSQLEIDGEKRPRLGGVSAAAAKSLIEAAASGGNKHIVISDVVDGGGLTWTCPDGTIIDVARSGRITNVNLDGDYYILKKTYYCIGTDVTFSGSPKGETDPKMFGAEMDGTTDDGTIANVAADYARLTDTKIFDINGLSLFSTITVDLHGLNLILNGGEIIGDSTGDGYTLIKAGLDKDDTIIAASTSLDADVLKTDNVVSIPVGASGDAFLAAISRGDKIVLRNDKVLYPTDALESYTTLSELFVIDDISGRDITISETPYSDFLVSDGNLIIQKLNTTEFSVTGKLTIKFNDLNVDINTIGMSAISVNNLNLSNIDFVDCNGMGAWIETCYGFNVTNITGSFSKYLPAVGAKFGYLVNTSNMCKRGVVSNLNGTSIKHTFTNGASPYDANNRNAGRVRGIKVLNSFGSSYFEEAPIDTHLSGVEIEIDNCTAFGTSGLGFNARAESVKFTNCTANGVSRGVGIEDSIYPTDVTIEKLKCHGVSDGVMITNKPVNKLIINGVEMFDGSDTDHAVTFVGGSNFSITEYKITDIVCHDNVSGIKLSTNATLPNNELSANNIRINGYADVVNDLTTATETSRIILDKVYGRGIRFGVQKISTTGTMDEITITNPDIDGYDSIVDLRVVCGKQIVRGGRVGNGSAAFSEILRAKENNTYMETSNIDFFGANSKRLIYIETGKTVSMGNTEGCYTPNVGIGDLYMNGWPTVELISGTSTKPILLRCKGNPEMIVAAPVGTKCLDVADSSYPITYMKGRFSTSSGWELQPRFVRRTSSPTVDDDVDRGFAVGSTWENYAVNHIYRCVGNSDGAAVWHLIPKELSITTALTTYTLDLRTYKLFYKTIDSAQTFILNIDDFTVGQSIRFNIWAAAGGSVSLPATLFDVSSGILTVKHNASNYDSTLSTNIEALILITAAGADISYYVTSA